ncbi:MAG: hypothetical protein HND48_05250 [Chloroflexi bacterium]|nr:hypothetical protein [Chloroflexota bacterium]
MTKPWRVHLANSAIVHVDLVPGNPELVAAWALDGVAAVYDLERGNAYGAATFTLPAGHAERWAYLQAFKLPHVARWSHACNLPVHVWSSAKHAVIYTGDATFTLCAGPDDRPKTLTFDVVPDAFAVDAAAQIVVALDSKGALLIGKIGGGDQDAQAGPPADARPPPAAADESAHPPAGRQRWHALGRDRRRQGEQPARSALCVQQSRAVP